MRIFFRHFVRINFRELGFTKDFVGINFRESGFTKDFTGINFRELKLKDFADKFCVCLTYNLSLWFWEWSKQILLLFSLNKWQSKRWSSEDLIQKILYQIETPILAVHKFLKNFKGINLCNLHFRGSRKEFNFSDSAKIREIFFPRKFLSLRYLSHID